MEQLNNVRALWTYDSAINFFTDAALQDEFFDFLEAPHGNPEDSINRIYFEARGYNKDFGITEPFLLDDQYDYLRPENAAPLREFIQRAHAEGIAVEYLDGQPVWVRDEEFNGVEAREIPVNIVRDIIAYNSHQDTPADARFDGIHLDIEPHIWGPEWFENSDLGGQDRYNDIFQNNLLYIVNEARRLIDESGQELTLSIDLGTDYAFYVTDLIQELDSPDSPLDYVTILNYFETIDGFVNGGADGHGGVQENLDLLQHLPLVFGAETIREPFAPDEISFNQEGVEALEEVLDQVHNDFSSNPQFRGFAIHHYESYRDLISNVPEEVPISERAPDINDVRALWTYDSAINFFTDAALQDEFFDFLEAPHGNPEDSINRIYFEARGYNKDFGITEPFLLDDQYDYLRPENAAPLREFIQRAHAEGIAVEYLDGQPVWVRDEEFNGVEAREIPVNIVRDIIAYNSHQDTPADARFDGIHLDIEPHIWGPEWFENSDLGGQDRYNDIFQNNLLYIVNEARRLIDESGQELTLSIDLGTDYAFYVSDLIQALDTPDSPLDYVTILNYFETIDGFVNGGADGHGGVQENLDLLQHLPLVFGAETIREPFAPDEISFNQEGVEALEEVLDQVHNDFSSNPQFRGFAIHHYESYRDLISSDMLNYEGARIFIESENNSSPINYVDGSPENDNLFAEGSNNIFRGYEGNDYIRSGEGADILDGGEGLDTAIYHNSDAAINIDITDNSTGSGGSAEGDYFRNIERVFASNYNDIVRGNRKDNDLFGGHGDDQLYGDFGTDELHGQAGNDLLVGGQGNDRLHGGDGNDNIFGGGGADYISGGRGNDNAYGGDSDDTIFGDSGDDLLDGGVGADILDGGEGFDVAIYSTSGAGVIVDLATGLGYLGYANGDRLSNIEGILGSSHSDNLYGNDDDNYIEGASGDDLIKGLAGDDTLIGGLGNDKVYGGNGNDFITGGIGHDILGGGSGNDNISGDSGNDKLYGGDGDDVLSGGSGNDYLEGGDGADTLIGGSGRYDAAIYWNAESGVGVDLQNGGFAGEANGDTYEGIERVFGSRHNDTIIGDDFSNTLIGGSGNDILAGGSGNDILAGGLGQDIFVFGDLLSLNIGHNIIEDFEQGQDLIQIGGDIALENLKITVDNGQTTITANGKEDDSTITLMGEFQLDESDFIF